MLKFKVQIKFKLQNSNECHPEPCPESSNAILNLFQDEDLRFQGLDFGDDEINWA